MTDKLTKPGKFHTMESRRHALKSMSYHGNGMVVPIKVTMINKHNQTRFELAVKEHDICVVNASIDDAYQIVCGLLDDKTLIEWVPQLVVGFEHGIETDFGKGEQSGIQFRLYSNIDIELVETGRRLDGKDVTREHGRFIKSGLPRVGIDEHGSSFNALEMTTVESMVLDTPENRAAFLALAAEFDRLHKQLHDLLSPKQIQKALSMTISRGLLGPAPVTKRKGKLK